MILGVKQSPKMAKVETESLNHRTKIVNPILIF